MRTDRQILNEAKKVAHKGALKMLDRVKKHGDTGTAVTIPKMVQELPKDMQELYKLILCHRVIDGVTRQLRRDGI